MISYTCPCDLHKVSEGVNDLGLVPGLVAGWLARRLDLTFPMRSAVISSSVGLACSGLAACSDDRDDDHPGRVDKQHANSSKTGERSIDLSIYLSIYLHIYLSK